MEAPTLSPRPFRRVEHHMSTAVSLGGTGVDDAAADAFFGRIAELEDLLSRFRPGSEVSRFARGELALDDADPAVREVMARCEALHESTGGDFEHRPRRGTGRPDGPELDVNAVAKGWIIDEASALVAMTAGEWFVNAGGDVLAGRRLDGGSWRIGIQHPSAPDAVLGTVVTPGGAVATSGTYERGAHIRSGRDRALVSVTVVGTDLATADGLSTAVFAAGVPVPPWWDTVRGDHGLLTVDDADRVRWLPPAAPLIAAGFDWRPAAG